MTSNPIRPNIFEYNNIYKYIGDYCTFLIKERNLSYRAIAIKCKINSPGYIQKILQQKRPITFKFVKKFSDAFIQKQSEAKFLMSLFAYESSNDVSEKNKVVDSLLQMSKKAVTKEIEDQSMYQHWIYGVIYELVNIKGMDTRLKVTKRLNKIASSKTINQAIDFLTAKQYLIETDKKLKLSEPVNFKFYNDRQRILEIQQNHNFFLNLARMHLIDNLDEREYQGMTIAIKKDNLNPIKEILRDTILEIREKFADDPDAEDVYRIQLSTFKVC